MKPIPTTIVADADPLTIIRGHMTEAEKAIRKGCEHIALGGLWLCWLHRSEANFNGGDRRSISVSHGDKLKKGFPSALEQIGMTQPTAYRWMCAAQKAVYRATLLMEGEDFREELPEPGTSRWEQWENGIREVAERSTLKRLMYGSLKPSTEEDRYDALLCAEEDGKTKAAELLIEIENGDCTLVQAVRALGGAESTKGKERRDPVYLTYDGEKRTLGGLLPKAFVTLKNGCQQWETYTKAERAALRELWQIIRADLPDELFTTGKS